MVASRRQMLRRFLLVAIVTLGACDPGGATSADAGREAAVLDGGDGALRDGGDAASIDAGAVDAGAERDADPSGDAAGERDAADLDADLFRDAYVGIDAAVTPDAFTPDAFTPDAFTPDAFTPDAFVPVDAFVARDASSGGGCLSGASGTHVIRFRWAGSGPGSTAYVMYEANTLPDTSRWRVSAASSSIGYTPRFDDTFLGEGGLDLSGTVFIDVELSTSGLSSISNVSIAIYGRSFATTSSGSFRWQTFTGVGATPSGSVANSAPYEWYLGDATSAFVAGDSGVLLRLRAGPPSSALVVNRVEVCFTAS